jgi:hypothetical protein
MVSLCVAPSSCHCTKVFTLFFQAESITEGTLKQWSKQVGDFVNQDEEIATIETDKVCPANDSYTATLTLLL